MACCPIRPRESILQSTWAHAPKPWLQSFICRTCWWRLSSDGDKAKSTYNFMSAPLTFLLPTPSVVATRHNLQTVCDFSSKHLSLSFVPVTPVSGSGLRVVEFETSAHNPLSPKNPHDQAKSLCWLWWCWCLLSSLTSHYNWAIQWNSMHQQVCWPGCIT